jgi:NitT/TauT family transport system substrate-binding protein
MSPGTVKTRWTSALAAMLSVVGTLATVVGCGSSAATATPAGPEKPDVTVAAVPATGAAGLYLAQQDGFFARRGLHVTILPSISAADVVADLKGGRIDVSLGQWTTAILVQAKHVADLKALAEGNAGAPQQVLTWPGSGISSPIQLKGKTIAVNALGGLAELEVLADLAGYQIGPAQVHFTVIPFPDMAAALAAHRVDAALLPEPYASQAQISNGDPAIFSTGQQGPTRDFPVVGYIVSRSWARRYPRTAAAFAAAIDQGQRIASTDRVAVEQVLLRYIGHLDAKTASVMGLGSYPDSVDPVPLGRVGDLMQQFPAISGLPRSVSVPGVIAELTR